MKCRQPDEPLDKPGFLAFFMPGLEGADLLVDGAQALLIRCSNDMRADDLLAVHLDLEHGVDIHLIKNDQLVAPTSVGLHMPVHVNGVPQAGHDEGAERKLLAGTGLVLADQLAGQRDVHLDQPVDGMLLAPQASAVDHQLPDPGVRGTGKTAVFLTHRSRS